MKNEFVRQASQKEQILDLLLERQGLGATNIELNSIAFRYGARIFQLRQEKWNIETQHDKKTGIFKFILHGKVQPKQLSLLEQTA